MKRPFSLLAWALLVISPLFFAAGCGDDSDDDDDVTVQYTLTITPPTGGTITASPASADGKYDNGTVVTLTATPTDSAAMMFEAWSGDASGTTSPTTVTMNADKTVGCTFKEIAAGDTYALTVTQPDEAYGAVTLSPDGGSYAAGTEVTLTFTPEAFYSGHGVDTWTDDLDGVTGNSTTITMNEDKEVGVTLCGYYTVSIPEYTGGTATVTVQAPGETTPVALVSGSTVKAGSTITVTATPAEGFIVDSVFQSVPVINPFWIAYDEELANTASFAVNDSRLLSQIYAQYMGGYSYSFDAGACFVADTTGDSYNFVNNVVYAKPDVKELNYDVYTPKSATAPLPAVIIIHGGGWNTNDEDIMRGQARSIVNYDGGKYVAVSIDYRFLATADGGVNVTMNQIIEDCFGAILHIQENADTYGIDPAKISVTGDSAGGHLSAVMVNMSDKIGEGGWGTTAGVYEFVPTYMPEGMTVAQAKAAIQSSILAGAPSYGVFEEARLTGRADAALLPYIAPQSNIPDTSAGGRTLAPQYVSVGSEDTTVVSDNNNGDQAEVNGPITYYNALLAAGQSATWRLVDGATHAYFDWKPDPTTQATYNSIGEPEMTLMMQFFDTVFYPVP